MNRLRRARVSHLIHLACLAIAAITVLSGCGGRVTALETAVERYNRLLPVVLETGDVSKMGSSIGAVESHRLEGYVERLRLQGKTMRTKLEKLTFVSSRVIKSKRKDVLDKGLVKTREWWTYRTENNLGSTVKVERIYYSLKYTLYRAPKNQWYIDKLDIEKQKDLPAQ